MTRTIFCMFMLGSLLLPTVAVLQEHPGYESRAASRDGIGKYYLDREISHVMGHLGASWLERSGRESEERTDLLIDMLLATVANKASVVADIGAGTGYFSLPIAQRLASRKVASGQVLAVDIQPEMLAIIERRKTDLEVNNVETILGTITDPGLPAGTLDLIFIVDAYHEFSHPYEMGLAMQQALKPDGVLVLIEYRAEDLSVPIKPLHKMSQQQTIKEMAAIGLVWRETLSALPQQHFMVFAKL
jgi:ubiquinone/menaquinone biosynthesis C-methylase UbiE